MLADPIVASSFARISLGTAQLQAHPSGALWWPDEAVLLVADLHFEKGTSFARNGVLLPPYDTRATLARLGAVMERYRPSLVVALGDSFHDVEAAARFDPVDHFHLTQLIGRQDWIWISGNHDPDGAPPTTGLGGRVLQELDIGGITLRHEADTGAGFEISGHYHPKASLRIRGRGLSCRCFVADASRLIMPAFGAYAGGLDVRDVALRRWFPGGFTAFLAGTARITSVPSWLLFGSSPEER